MSFHTGEKFGDQACVILPNNGYNTKDEIGHLPLRDIAVPDVIHRN